MNELTLWLRVYYLSVHKFHLLSHCFMVWQAFQLFVSHAWLNRCLVCYLGVSTIPELARHLEQFAQYVLTNEIVHLV